MQQRNLSKKDIELLKCKFDTDLSLQAVYNGSFEAYLAYIRDRLGPNSSLVEQGIQHITPQHCF